MANNLPVTPGAGTSLRTTEALGVHTPWHLEDDTQRTALLAALAAIDPDVGLAAIVTAITNMTNATLSVDGPVTAEEMENVGLATENTLTNILNALNEIALTAPSSSCITVVPNDATVLANVRGLQVGGAGTVIATVGGSDFTFNCIAGQFLRIRATKVKLASTATNIIAYT